MAVWRMVVSCGAVFFDEFFDEVGAFEDDAAAGVFRGGLAEILEERGLGHGLVDAARVADVLGGELDDRAGLDGAAGGDVVADAGGHRAERLALVVVVGVDDGDGQLGAHVDDELADAPGLFRGEGEFRVDFRADGTVGVIPGVVDAALDEAAEPILA